MKRTVRVPKDTARGREIVSIELDWVCPTCGGPRGEPHDDVVYDGSHRLACDGWDNPCGHRDMYHMVLNEADGIAWNGWDDNAEGTFTVIREKAVGLAILCRAELEVAAGDAPRVNRWTQRLVATESILNALSLLDE